MSLFFFSCLVNKSNISTLNLENNAGQSTISDLYTEFEFISLETNTNSIFGEINKLVVHDKKYFILDKMRTKKILVFNEDGTFIHTIGKIGNGPGEYINIEDFTIDHEKEQLVVLTYPSTIIKYNYDGDFIDKIKLTSKSVFWNIESYKNGYVCSTNQQSAIGDNLIHFYDKEFTLNNSLIDPLSFQIPLPPFISNPIQKANNNLYYFDNFTSTLYSNITNEMEFNTLKLNIDVEMQPEKFKDVQDFFTNQQQYSFYIDATIKNNTLYAMFLKKGEPYDLIFDLETKVYRASKAYGWRPKTLYYDGNWLYSSINSQMLSEINIEKKDKTKYPVTIDSNPLILKYKVKGNK